jgi:hypothetical protein
MSRPKCKKGKSPKCRAHKQISTQSNQASAPCSCCRSLSSDVRCAIAFPIAPNVQGGMQEAGMPMSKQRGRVRRSTGSVMRALVARGRQMGVGTRISGCWVDDGGHDRGVRRWGVGCRRPEAEKAGCQSRAGAVYDGGELVVLVFGQRKFQRGCVATAGGRYWAEGGGRVVVEVRLRGGGGRDRAKQARADRGVVGNGRRGGEGRTDVVRPWEVCVCV